MTMLMDGSLWSQTSLIACLRAHPNALVNCEGRRGMRPPPVGQSGAFEDNNSRLFKAVMFGAVAGPVETDPLLRQNDRTLTLTLCRPDWNYPEARNLFDAQLTKLGAAATAAAACHPDVVHPFNVFRWTSTSLSVKWVDDDWGRLSATRQDDHILVEIACRGHSCVFEVGGFVLGMTASEYLESHRLCPGDVVVFQGTLRVRTWKDTTVPLREFRIIATTMRVLEVYDDVSS
ncbi:hypothetical protein B0H10DRAFT_1944023 [Mycena sp. CBHHK59/15]|nr:hypothetical protein B0H10DRAFT_1944023 [Mycena sp. CBHHK59/15]